MSSALTLTDDEIKLLFLQVKLAESKARVADVAKAFNIKDNACHNRINRLTTRIVDAYPELASAASPAGPAGPVRPVAPAAATKRKKGQSSGSEEAPKAKKSKFGGGAVKAKEDGDGDGDGAVKEEK